MNPVNERKSPDVFIPEDWLEFAEWLDSSEEYMLSRFIGQKPLSTNVSTWNQQFIATLDSGEKGYYSSPDFGVTNKERVIYILMLCAAIEAGDTFISPENQFDSLGINS